MPSTWIYQGRNRQDAHAIGTTRLSVAYFVEAKYRARWEELEVFSQHDPDTVVGRIYRDDEGKRHWWADTTVG